MRFLPTILTCLSLLFLSGLQDAPRAQSPLAPAPASEAAPEVAAEAAPEVLPSDSARALIDAIENPESRAALVEMLRKVADGAGQTAGQTANQAGAAAGTPGAAAEAAPATAEPSQTSRVADSLSGYAQHVAEGVNGVIRQTLRSFDGLAKIATGRVSADWERLGDAALRLAVVAFVTFLAFYLVRLVARRIFSAMARRAAGKTLFGRFVAVIVSAFVDEAAVLLAWATGYGFALFTGEAANININQSLFLNAFLLIETIKVGMRVLFSPSYGELRPLPIQDRGADYTYFWLARLVGMIGYGFLLFVPIVNLNLSFFAGRGLRVLIALTAMITAIVLIVRNRRAVAASINRIGHRMGAFGQSTLGVAARIWHVLAILYVIAFFVIWISRPGEALSFMIAATFESAAAVLVASLVMALIARLILGGISLPDDVKARLPLLESRLNRLVPSILKVVRIVLFFLVALAILHAWALFDVLSWMASDAGSTVVAGLTAAAAVALVAMVIWLAMSSWVDYRLNPSFGTVPTARERTLLSLFKNAATIAIVLFGSMIALSEIGVDIGPLLAGAGVLGLAIGFGAQKLVQDIITGVFIQFENAANEGDVVTLAGISGVVEKLTVRSVSLRDLDGVFHVIPFSSVDSVSNFMRGFGYHKAEIGVAYRENIADVKAHMHIAFDRLLETEHAPKILEPLEMHGVTAFGDSAVVVRARIKTRPGDQWAVGRAYNEILKEVFDEAGIEIPFPHMTLWWGEDKAGNAPPLRLRQTGSPRPRPETPASPASPEVGDAHHADVVADDD